MKPIAFSPPWLITEEKPAGPAGEAAAVSGPRQENDLESKVVSSRYRHIPVIVAEDDPVSRTLMTSVVGKWGFRSVITQNGLEAMEAVRAEEGPAVAILDWMMPEIDGLEVCRRIRESGKAIYVILLTARGSKENIVEGLQAGADDYLSKPFDKEELLARVRVGLRILELHANLSGRIQELERITAKARELKLELPI